MKSRSVCIIYGLNEGPAMGRELCKSLREAGFTISDNPATADVIFAHSGGCYLIPQQNQAKLIVLAGLPYWPGRPWVIATTLKVWQEARAYNQLGQSGSWALKWLFHIRYAFNLRAAIRMALNRTLDKPWNSTQPQIIVRNRHDAYCGPDLSEVPFKGPRTFISLPGEHDDCWENPERYVNLLQSVV
jgi:hypothetical protein